MSGHPSVGRRASPPSPSWHRGYRDGASMTNGTILFAGVVYLRRAPTPRQVLAAKSTIAPTVLASHALSAGSMFVLRTQPHLHTPDRIRASKWNKIRGRMNMSVVSIGLVSNAIFWVTISGYVMKILRQSRKIAKLKS